MKFGIMHFATEYTLDLREIARGAEDLGYESLFLPEHTHIPIRRDSQWPGGAELTVDHKHLVDPFVGLATAAAVTKRLLIGTGICLVTERDPIVLAKEVASLDLVSRGRFIFGISAGWNREEMRDHGTDPSVRLAVLRERVDAMKRIWTQEEAEFHGRFVDFDPIWSWPKPLQRPHPPIVLGGNGPTTLRRAVAYCDGWAPNVGKGDDFLEGRLAELEWLCLNAGRAPIPVSALGGQPTTQRIDRLIRLGIQRWVFRLPTTTPGETLPLLEEYSRMIRPYQD